MHLMWSLYQAEMEVRAGAEAQAKGSMQGGVTVKALSNLSVKLIQLCKV